MDGRIIIIGDVHGCARELQELLDMLDPQPDDHFLFAGDLINKGPDSRGTLDLFYSLPNAQSVMGNHERRLLRYHDTGDPMAIKSGDWNTLPQLQPKDWECLRRMPLTIQLPELDTVLVHGGFLPGQPWSEQGIDIVTHVQVIDSNGQPARRTDCPEGIPWADQWQGPPFVIYGHTPRPKVYRRPWSLGLDTGCVYGGTLTACLLPEREIIQVPAHRIYSSS